MRYKYLIGTGESLESIRSIDGLISGITAKAMIWYHGQFISKVPVADKPLHDHFYSEVPNKAFLPLSRKC